MFYRQSFRCLLRLANTCHTIIRMKDMIPIIGVGVALATLMFMLETGTRSQIENFETGMRSQIENLQTDITRLDDRVYELNERVTRNQVLLEEFLQSQSAQ